jgi:peptidoglycan hydrolase CwlO-like protein
MQMNYDFKLAMDELDKKRKFFEDQTSINSKLEKEIEFLDGSVSDFSMKLVREKQSKQNFSDELAGLKGQVESMGKELQKTRYELTDIKRNILDKQNQ